MECVLCKSSLLTTVKVYTGHNPIFSGAEICQCVECGMQMVSPLPTQKKWDSYNKSYFLNAHGGLNTSSWVETFNVAIAKIRFNALKKFLVDRNLKLNSILEVGPGPGYLMCQLKREYPNLKYFVVETDASVHSRLQDNGAILVEATTLPKKEKVDAIIASHVVEHTLDPIGFLTHFTSMLRRGGAVFVETPCLDHRYKNIYEPHVLFFNKNTLGKLLERCNLSQIKLTYNGDKIPSLRRNSFLRKCAVKFELKTGAPCHKFLGKYWAMNKQLGLTYDEAMAIVETSPHVEQDVPARWVRGFGIKEND